MSFVPSGVLREPKVELPADDQVEYTNAISRRFVAHSDEALALAAQKTFETAVADGWVGPPLSDPGSGGVPGTTLEKGEMSLSISYRTSASFDLLEFDEDVLALDVLIETRSPDLGG